MKKFFRKRIAKYINVATCLAFLVLGPLVLVSCVNEPEWVDSIDKDMNFWTSPDLSIYYVNKENKGLVDIDKPETWPIISEKRLSATELEEAREVAGKTAMRTQQGVTYSEGHAKLYWDSFYNMVYLVPQVKCNNTGAQTTYIYFRGSEDALNATFRYTYDNGEWYIEVKSIKYNDTEIFRGGMGAIGSFITK